MFKRNHRGFTLVELLVVIAIIGLLSTLAVASLNSAKRKSRDAKRLADLNQVRSALELYAADKSTYPGTVGTSYTLGEATAVKLCSTGFLDASTACTGDILMGRLPADPSMVATTAVCGINPTATCKYAYKTLLSGAQYEIYAYLEGSANNGTLADGICLSEVGFSNTGCDH